MTVQRTSKRCDHTLAALAVIILHGVGTVKLECAAAPCLCAEVYLVQPRCVCGLSKMCWNKFTQDFFVVGNFAYLACFLRLPSAQATQQFLETAGSEVERLDTSLKSSAEAFKQLAAYINGAANAKMPDPQSFFTLLSSFASDLDTAHDENLQVDAQVWWPRYADT